MSRQGLSVGEDARALVVMRKRIPTPIVFLLCTPGVEKRHTRLHSLIEPRTRSHTFVRRPSPVDKSRDQPPRVRMTARKRADHPMCKEWCFIDTEAV